MGAAATNRGAEAWRALATGLGAEGELREIEHDHYFKCDPKKDPSVSQWGKGGMGAREGSGTPTQHGALGLHQSAQGWSLDP